MPAKRIYRNQRDKVIGGVCAGLADYFDIDVAWIRLAFVLSVFASGFGILAYVIAWIVFPRDERSEAQLEADRARLETARESQDTESKQRRAAVSIGSRNAVGVILILLGLLFFMDQNFWWFRFDAFWPVLLIGLGVYMLVRTGNGTVEEPVAATAATGGATPPAPLAGTPVETRDATAPEPDAKREETGDA